MGPLLVQELTSLSNTPGARTLLDLIGLSRVGERGRRRIIRWQFGGHGEGEGAGDREEGTGSRG